MIEEEYADGSLTVTSSNDFSTWERVRKLDRPVKTLKQSGVLIMTYHTWTYEMKCIAVNILYNCIPKGIVDKDITSQWNPYVAIAVRELKRNHHHTFKYITPKLVRRWFGMFALKHFDYEVLQDSRCAPNNRTQIVPRDLLTKIIFCSILLHKRLN